MVAQWLVHLIHKQKVEVQIPLVVEVFFHKYFWWDFVGDHLSGWAVIKAVQRMKWAAYKVQ